MPLSEKLTHKLTSFLVGLTILALFGLVGVLAVPGCDNTTSAPPAPPADPSPSPDPADPAKPAAATPAASQPPHDHLQIVGSIPLEGEPFQGRFTAFFDRSLAWPKNSDRKPFTFDPPIEGEYNVGENYVSFTSYEGTTAPVYKLTFDPEFASVNGHTLAPDDRTIALSPFEFRPESFWHIETTDELIMLGIRFPTAVNAESLREHLRVTDVDGQAVNTETALGEGGYFWRITIPATASLPVRVEVTRGLTDVTGSLSLTQDYSFIHPEAQRLYVYYAGWSRFDNDAKVVVLRFSEAVSHEVLREQLQFTTPEGAAIEYQLAEQIPSEQFHVQLTEPGELVNGLAVTIGEDLSGQTRSLLAGAYTANLPNPRATDTPQTVRVSNVTWGNVYDGEQEIIVEFNTSVMADEVASHLTLSRADSGVEIPFDMQSKGLSDRHMVKTALESPAQVEVQYTVKEGLSGALSLSLAEAETGTVLRDTYPLAVDYTWWDSVGREGLALVLSLNQRVDLESLKEHLRVEPAIDNLAVERAYGSQFRIFGEWQPETQYTITLTEGLTYAGGATLDAEVVYATETYDIPPFIGFGQEGLYYFPRRDGLTLTIDSRNVSTAHLKLHQMFPSNIAVAVSSMNAGEASTYFGEKWSRMIAERDIELQSQGQKLARTPLQLDEIFPEADQGVFMLEVTADEYYTATKLVLFTNIGVLSHWTDNELVLFAHNLYSLAPLPAANVTVYSSKNQVLGTMLADGQGMAHFRDLDENLGTPSVAVVEHEGDYTFLELSPRNDSLDAVDASMPKYDREGYDAFLYADRDLYRPGEPVHLRWTVRTNFGDAVQGVPFEIEIIQPNGETLLTETSTMSEWGTGGMDVQTEQTYATGMYTAQLRVPGSESFLGSYKFKLEDFVPDRMKATVELAETTWVSGQEYGFTVYAEHLFGGAAQNRRTEAEVILRRGAFKPEGWGEYAFNNDSEFTVKRIPLGEGETDDAGKVIFTYTPRLTEDITFPLQAIVQAAVYEVGGRAVIGRETAVLVPADVALGVAVSPVPTNDGFEAHVAAITVDGQPANVPNVRVTLEKQVWNYYVRRYISHDQPSWTQSWEEVKTQDVSLVDGRGSAKFNVFDWGYYRVKVTSDATPLYSTQSFYSYGGRVESVDQIEPGLISVEAARESYAVGEVVTAKLESPFDGQGIAVIQGDRIQQMIPITISRGVGEITFTATADMFPNVWIEATVVHAIDKEHRKIYPFSSFDMTNVKIHDPQRQLVVSFPDLPEEMRPQQELTVTLQVQDAAGAGVPAEVTLAAVDEGIHSITNYANPDPYAWLRRPRAPELRRAHYYDKVAYDFDAPSPGGDLEGLAKRVATVDENWIKPLALWSGAVTTDANGMATVTLQLPEFNGQIRLVAVAVSQHAVGAGAQSMYVRRPYVLRTSMPRFMLPGDRAECNATIYNRSKQPIQAEIGWTVSGPLSTQDSPTTIEVPADGEAAITAPFTAAEAVGQAEITWNVVVRAADGNELDRLTEVAPMPIRPPAAYQSANTYVAIAPGEEAQFANERFVDDARLELAMIVTANPLLRVQDALRYLVGYPYGCVEQTTSRLFPMYLFAKASDLSTAVLQKEEKNVDNYMRAGIARLFSMQTPSGGLGYWPGAVHPSEYSSIYALHFLTLVKNGREYDLPEENYQRLVDYVKTIANDWDSNSMSHLYERAYATYVLAIGGDLESIEQIHRFDTVTIPRAARYLLAAALAKATSDYDRVKMYLQTAPMEPYVVREMSGTFNSEVRNNAVELLAMLQMQSDPATVADKAKQLVAFLEENRWGTTQETAFIVAALSLYLNQIGENPADAAGVVRGPNGESTITGFEVYHQTHAGPGGAFSVRNTGQKPLYVSFTAAGVPKTGNLPAERHNLAVNRKFFTATGEDFTGSTFDSGKTYIVELTITPEQPVENLLVVDLLPAGFEIENPRLRESAMPPNLAKEQSTPTHTDVRDDRLVLAYDHLGATTSRFYYVVRAVTPGSYQHPPLQSEVMYDPSIFARTEPGAITVAPRE